jgi:L-amino acid N-acyltransferase YncA
MRVFGPWACAAGCPYRALMTASRECQLADGRVVVLRLACPGDVPAITRPYLELSPESFYRRFNTEQPAPALVAQLASLGSGDACLVAGAPSDPGRVVAEARYVPIAPWTAELALTVHDSYQGAGVGHLLLDALAERARAEGLERLRAVVLLANTPDAAPAPALRVGAGRPD